MRDDEEKKDPNEMTTDEAGNYLFPPEVVEHLKNVARESEVAEDSNGDDSD